MTRQLLGEIVANANPHPSGTAAHEGLRELITRIAREEIIRAASTTTGTVALTGSRGDLDRAGAPLETEPPLVVSELPEVGARPRPSS